ncbi:MAG: hypothetical protein J1E05_02735 [Eubacterium sp.]|nr:hypothetical protein [Eubacterium sp.]
MNFSRFIGNEKVKEQLSFLISSKRLPHAIVLEGEEGIGKRTLAREIACALVCRGSAERPCGECAQCKKAQKGIHPDIFEYSAAGGARSFHVDVVREVINSVYMSPNEAENRIYILGNAHCMNESAQNAILKVLEEPPAYAVFILTVSSRTMLLETVLSRSVVISLDGVDAALGAEYICAHNENTDYSEALEAMIAFKGNIGKASESLIGGKMQKTVEMVNKLCAAIAADREYELIKCGSAFSKDRQELVTVLELLKTVFRDALIGSKTGELLSGQAEAVKMLSQKFAQKRLLKLYNTAEELIEMANKNANNALLITKVCYSLREAAGR